MAHDRISAAGAAPSAMMPIGFNFSNSGRDGRASANFLANLSRRRLTAQKVLLHYFATASEA